jgi:hypothetical protein
MIDILYNKLGSLNDLSLAEWKDIEPAIFNRHAQHVQHSRPTLQEVKTVHEPPVVPTNTTKVPTKVPTNTTKVPTKVPTNTTKVHTNTTKVPTKTTKSTTIKPLDIIVNETTAFHNSTDYIKESLITFITKDEFSKIFGMTKCAEIMSGIVNNRWNKSTALFISFLLDKEVYYNEKVIVYNKEKNKGRITI